MKSLAERVTYNKRWRAATPDRVAAYKKRWPRNPETKAAYDKQWQRENRDKVSAYCKKWYDANRRKKLDYRRRYRMESADKIAAYERANLEQRAATSRRHAAKKNGHVECTVYPPRPGNSRCVICEHVRKLVLDHDHNTGEFRGYICRDCNLGIGKLGDDLDGLLRAVEYLRRTRGA